jgi:nitrite reductase/ring-hydroxylating ferredoxin subunit
MLVKLCDKDIMPIGELKSFKIKEFEVMAVNLGNKAYCLDARCTHAGAPLSEGALEGTILTCPWHYSQFDITNGAVLRGPAGKPLKAYHIVERQNAFFIDL